MPLSMYDASAPAFLKMLQNLSALLDKAAAHAEAKGIDALVLASARLAPDMHPLTRQVQIACDTAKGCAARLAEVEVPSHPDTETTLAELQARIATTAAFIQALPASAFDGAEDRNLTLKLRGQDMVFPAKAYLIHFALPNFYFHVTTAYAILRHNGVEIGKPDYIGGLPG